MKLQACKTDLFGKSAEEKEVKQIAGNLMEARANRSYDIFHILAEFTTQKCLLDLIIPLKEVWFQFLVKNYSIVILNFYTGRN